MHRTVADTTAEQIRTFRMRRGMSQEGLAERMNQLGARIDRSVVAKVESRRRAISLEDVFRYALALDVAPVHLIVPIDSTEPIHLAPNFEAAPHEVRKWIRGFTPMLQQDPRVYFSQVPRSEFRAASEALAAWNEDSPLNVTTEPDQED